MLTICPSCGSSNRVAGFQRASRGIWRCGRCGHTLEELAADEMFTKVFVSDAGTWEMVILGGACILTAILAAVATVFLDSGTRWALGGIRIVLFPCLLGGMLIGFALRFFSLGNRSKSAFIVLGVITFYAIRWWCILGYPATLQQLGTLLLEHSHRPFDLLAGGQVGSKHAHAEMTGSVFWFWLLFLLDAVGVIQGVRYGCGDE